MQNSTHDTMHIVLPLKIVHRFRRLPLWLRILLVFLAGLCIGAVLTYQGTYGWDDKWQLAYSRYLLSLFQLYPPQHPTLRLFGPLPELLLGIATEYIFFPLNDPFWVRHTLVFALFPLTLYLHFLLLRKGGISNATALLATAAVFGIIRFGGHALVNVKDFPAACVYLIVTLAQWHLLRRCLNAKGSLSRFWLYALVLLGVVSILPYLVRTPLILHFMLTIAVCVFAAITHRDLEMEKRILLIVIPIISGIIFASLLFPDMWGHGFFGSLERSVQFYADHPRRLNARLFGIELTKESVPRWYVLSWIVVIAHPLALLGALAGIVLPFIRRRKAALLLTVPTQTRTWGISLHQWMWAITLIGFLGIVTINPYLYNEERHVLFLYPLFFSSAVLGLDSLRSSVKHGLSVLLVSAAFVAYFSWGIFSYIYINPLLRMTNIEHFTSDYWSICLPKAISAIQENVPAGNTVFMENTAPSGSIQKERLREGLLFQKSTFGPYEFVYGEPDTGAYYSVHSVFNNKKKVLRDIEDGSASLI